MSPDCSFELLKAALDAATSELLIYIYNVSAPHIIERIAAARDRGAKVRIMYDAKDTSGDEANKLKALGVELKVAPSRDPRRVFDVCHQKFAVIDKKLVIMGSANWAASGIPKRLPGTKRRAGNREWLLRIDHKGVAGWFRTLFNADFDIEEAPSFDIDFEVEVREEAAATPSFAPPLDTAAQAFSQAGRSGDAAGLPGQLLLARQEADRQGDETAVPATPIHHRRPERSFGGQAAGRGEGPARRRRGRPHHRQLAFRAELDPDQGHARRARLEVEPQGHQSRPLHSLPQQGRDCRRSRRRELHQLERELRPPGAGSGVEVHSKPLAQYFAVVFEDDWDNGWTIAEGDAGPSFDVEAGVDVELAAVHPADQE